MDDYDQDTVPIDPTEAKNESAIPQRLKGRRAAPKPRKTIVLQGTLDVLVMKALDRHRLTEYGIRKRIQEMAKGAFVVPQTSAIKAIERLTKGGWIQRYSRFSGKPGTKVYKLTLGARSHLKGEARQLTRKLNALLASISSE
jgi:DNA-binding PadR family transcriptional regulator